MTMLDSAPSLIAQVELRERTGESCPERNPVFCFDWAADNYDRYVDPTIEHIILVLVSVAAGFAIAFGLAYLSHRKRWLMPGFLGATGVLYTIPSLAFFALLLPITGRGQLTAIVALTAFNLQIIYRNMVAGLGNVPEEAKDAGRGMGMTANQLFRRVELPLAVPTIMGGVRTATINIVATATIAPLVGVLTLGDFIINTNVYGDEGVLAGAILVALMALTLELTLAGAQWLMTSPGLRLRQE